MMIDINISTRDVIAVAVAIGRVEVMPSDD